MAKPPNGALIRQAAMRIKLGKLAVQRDVEEASSIAGSDRRRHCCMKCTRSIVFSAKSRRPFFAFRATRCCSFDGRGSGNQSLHLREKHLLARRLAAQVQVKAGLFHHDKRISYGAYARQTGGEVLQGLPNCAMDTKVTRQRAIDLVQRARHTAARAHQRAYPWRPLHCPPAGAAGPKSTVR